MSATPNGWEKISFRQILNRTLGGGTPSRSVGAYFQGTIPWFTVKDLKSQYPNKAEEYITKEAIENSSTNLVPAETLIVATRISLGKAIRPRVDCAINQDLKALFFVDGINPDFILHWFSANERLIKERGSGTTVQGIRLEALNSLPLLLPPSEEQTRIVEKLQELLPQLDAGMAELQAAQKKLTQYRQSLLKAAVEGQLTANWRKRNVPAEDGAQLLERILSERRARWEAKQLAKFNSQGKKPPKGWQDKYPEPARPDTANLPELPEGWVWATVDEISEVHSGSTPKGVENKSTELGETPWFRVGDMNSTGNETELTRSRINLTEEATLTLGLKKLPRNTIVFPKRGGAIATNKKRLLNRPSCIDLNMMGIVSNEALQDWVWAWFQTISLKSLSDGSNVPQINNPDITNLPIPIPPLGEQKEALKNIYDLSRENISLSDELHRSHLRASKQRQNILRAAFAGELVPQDPNDEPASELLARIAAERAAKQVSKRAPAEGNKPTAVEPSGTKRRKRKEAS